MLLPFGTTSNEALHAEIRAWFRETQQMHQSTLEIKLRVLHLAKIMTHHAGMYRPTLRQLPRGVVLARSVVSSAWSRRRSWSAFAGQSGKANLPLNARREQEASIVKAHAAKRPAIKIKRPAAKKHVQKKPSTHLHQHAVHRTPFNRVRVSSCHIMGKKRQQKCEAERLENSNAD